MPRVYNKKIQKQAGTDNTYMLTWTCSAKNVDHYNVTWYYGTGQGTWFSGGGTQQTTLKNHTYTPPDNATVIRAWVKPVAKTRKKNGKSVAYWTGTSTYITLYMSKTKPGVLSAPEIRVVNDTQIEVKLESIDDDRADHVCFYINRTDKTGKYGGGALAAPIIKVNQGRAIYTYKGSIAGYQYHCRVRGVNYYGSIQYWGDYSEWSELVSTVPKKPSAAPTLTALSSTSVRVTWPAVTGSELTYEIQYTTKPEYFEGSDQLTSVSDIATTTYTISGMETGQTYYFRVRAVNDTGGSAWSDTASVTLGKKPSAPTTWSSSTTVVVGEPLILYWVHNSEDGSSQRYAQLETTIGDRTWTEEIKNPYIDDEDNKDKTSTYTIDTTDYPEGTKIKWRVRTCGVTDELGDWSVLRTVDIYAEPSLELTVTDKEGELLETIPAFPFYISGETGPETQQVISYSVKITSEESYEDVDDLGEATIINVGDEVYSTYVDTNDPLLIEMLPSDINLFNGRTYKITCIASMNSGLSAEASMIITVDLNETTFVEGTEVRCGIGIDYDNWTAYLSPYCVSVTGDDDATSVETVIEDATISVYRREYDGRYVELGTDLVNDPDNTVLDPHPALDYARYRVVAQSKTTGEIYYEDIPAEPVGGTSIIIQWDEEWQSFDVGDVEDELEEQPWNGSMVILPYNVETSEDNSPDSVLVEYIGRSHPVGYYGTQLGTTASWNVVIPKEDKETLYALRRLAIWMGNVYVREPSGVGYWANITVSFSQKYDDLTIPVSLDISRVEGGA